MRNYVYIHSLVCSKFRDLNNGDVEYDSDAEDAETFQPGTVADFYCHIEHELFGPESAVCLDNGQWNNELPECLRKSTFFLSSTLCPGSLACNCNTFVNFN